MALFASAILCNAHAQTKEVWPSKPVRFVVPFTAGGSIDVLARLVGRHLETRLNQPIVVENRTGAGGTVGTDLVARAPADGYTLLFTAQGPLVLNPFLMKRLPYDATTFAPVTVVVEAPNVLVVPANSPHNTVADVIAFEKANPGKMTFASSGNGSSDHLTVELFWAQTGTGGVHVPYKGGAPAISDLLGGQVDASFQNVNAVLQHIRSGKLKALAVTGDKRSDVLPNVPTLGEAGVKGVDVYSWQAVVGPKGLPADVKAKMHDALVAALNDPKLKQQFVALGFEIVANTPEQFAAFEQRESARWKQLIDARKITAD